MLTTIHANDPINILERLEMEGVQARMIADRSCSSDCSVSVWFS